MNVAGVNEKFFSLKQSEDVPPSCLRGSDEQEATVVLSFFLHSKVFFLPLWLPSEFLQLWFLRWNKTCLTIVWGRENYYDIVGSTHFGLHLIPGTELLKLLNCQRGNRSALLFISSSFNHPDSFMLIR